MRQTLRLIAFSSLLLAAVQDMHAQNVGINANGAAPNAKALLDIDVSALGTKRGMMIPRMTYAQRLAITGLSAADQGLWVYQTDDGTNADPTLNSSLLHGYWYYEGAPTNAWVRWANSNVAWSITGNGNTNSTINFLGTAAGTNDDFHIRTTNTGVWPQILLSSPTGFVGINPSAAPVERLDIDGGLKIYTGSSTNAAGVLRYDTIGGTTTNGNFHYGNVTGTNAWQRLENAETRYTNQNYAPVVQVCGTTGQVIRGSLANNTIAGNQYTPFATNTGSNNRRGYRVQYIYPASELTAAGLCPGYITGFDFYALENDVVGCGIIISVRIGHTALNNFGPVVGSSSTPTTVDWDAVVQGSADVSSNTGSPGIVVNTGWVPFVLTGSGFLWNGVNNVVVDISWSRNTTIGVSPRVELETGLAYTASKWMQVQNPGSDFLGGDSYDDNPITVSGSPVSGAMVGTTSTRPVTRFHGQVTTNGYGSPTPSAYLQYGGGIVIDSASTFTWADANYRGPGSLRARVAVYDGNLLLSDHVFDRYYGHVSPAEEASSRDYAYVGLRDLKGYLQKERHLPNMPSREEWDQTGTRSLGELQTGLWETVENQALHITELEKDLSVLEELAFGKDSDAATIQGLIAEIESSRRLTEQQKLHLTTALKQRLSAQQDTK